MERKDLRVIKGGMRTVHIDGDEVSETGAVAFAASLGLAPPPWGDVAACLARFGLELDRGTATQAET